MRPARPALRARAACACAAACVAVPLLAAAPSRHPHFQEGVHAFKFGRWEQAAREMLEAHDDRSEDGRLRTRVYDRWFEPYLPLVYLGAALAGWGCPTEARQWLDRSAGCAEVPAGRGRDRKRCEKLLAWVDQKLSEQPANPPAPQQCAAFAAARGRPR